MLPRRCSLTLNLPLNPTLSRFWPLFPTPAFWHVLRAASASPFPRGRSGVSDATDTRPRRKGERRPTALPGDSIACALAERCQVSAFFSMAAQSGGLPDEESRTRHAPSERALVNSGGAVVKTRERQTLRRDVPYTAFPSGRPPDHGGDAAKL